MEEAKRLRKSSQKLSARVLSVVLGALLLIGIGVGIYALYIVPKHEAQKPVGLLKQAVKKTGTYDFPVYYPASTALPAGYVPISDSVKSPQSGVVLYSIRYDGNKSLIVAEQKRPSDTEIQNFYSNYIPLRNKLQTNKGQAELGAHSINAKGTLKTVVSLPLETGTWLIVTAPYDINQDQLKQVLNALEV